MLIRAFAQVKEKEKNTKLIIVGEGELRRELEEIIEKYDLKNYVSMLGQCNNVQERLNASDVFVQSSDYEGLPISGLEAMACGLPIISTKAGGTVDIVKNGINGFLVDVGDEDELAQKNDFFGLRIKILVKKWEKNPEELLKCLILKNVLKSTKLCI
mgnify:CR=1 FL=1